MAKLGRLHRYTMILCACLLTGCEPTYENHEFVSNVKNTLDGGAPKEVPMETYVLSKKETNMVRKNETVIALVSNVQSTSILLLAIDHSKEATDTNPVRFDSGKGLRGWLLVNSKTVEGVGPLYTSGTPTPPKGFRAGISKKNDDGSFSYVNRGRLWAEWWRVANEGRQAQYGVEATPIEGSLVIDRKGSEIEALSIDLNARREGKPLITYRGEVKWKKVKRLRY